MPSVTLRRAPQLPSLIALGGQATRGLLALSQVKRVAQLHGPREVMAAMATSGMIFNLLERGAAPRLDPTFSTLRRALGPPPNLVHVDKGEGAIGGLWTLPGLSNPLALSWPLDTICARYTKKLGGTRPLLMME